MKESVLTNRFFVAPEVPEQTIRITTGHAPKQEDHQ